MLLGSIVRCWSETGMNSCPDPMVRRRQPYSSALLAMQAESQGNVWYTSRSRRPAQPCTAMQFGTLEHMHSVWTPFDRYLVYQNTDRQFRPLCVPRCFPDCGVIDKSLLHHGCMCTNLLTATPGNPIAVAAIYRLAAVPRNPICRKRGTQSSCVTDLCPSSTCSMSTPDEIIQPDG